MQCLKRLGILSEATKSHRVIKSASAWSTKLPYNVKSIMPGLWGCSQVTHFEIRASNPNEDGWGKKGIERKKLIQHQPKTCRLMY